MQYFENLTSEAEIKNRYKELAKKYHPDLGGCVEAMKVINRQYDEVLTGQYQKAGKSITEIEELLKNAHELRSKIYEIAAMPGIIVELCGEWIWVTGMTRPVKELLKAANFFWSNKKLAWYWRKEDSRKKWNRGEWDLDKIRSTYGSTCVNGARSKAIA